MFSPAGFFTSLGSYLPDVPFLQARTFFFLVDVFASSSRYLTSWECYGREQLSHQMIVFTARARFLRTGILTRSTRLLTSLIFQLGHSFTSWISYHLEHVFTSRIPQQLEQLLDQPHSLGAPTAFLPAGSLYQLNVLPTQVIVLPDGL